MISILILWPLLEEVGKWIYSRFFTGWRIMYPYVIWALFELTIYTLGDGVPVLYRLPAFLLHILTGLIMWLVINKGVALIFNIFLHILYNTIIITVLA